MAEKTNIGNEKISISELKKSIIAEVFETLRENGVIFGGENKSSPYRAMRKLRRECEAIFRR